MIIPPPMPEATSLPATIEKFDALLQTPQAQAILAAAEQRAAELINDLPAAGQTGTPGWRTSEFWCLVVFFLLALCTMLAGVLPPKWALACQTVSVGLYQISRGLTKHGTGN